MVGDQGLLRRVHALVPLPAPTFAASYCHPQPLMQIRHNSVRCFSAAAAARAGTLLPYRPFDPTSAVTAITGLKLSRVLLHSLSGRGPDEITYVFGRLPRTVTASLSMQRQPSFVVVVEDPNRYQTSHAVLYQTILHPPGQAGLPAPSTLSQNLSHRQTLLSVFADARSSYVYKLGARLVRLERQDG